MSVELVRAIKADLEARGVDLSGPCGAFQITSRVAWVLRETGAGLHAKPTGNHCDGYSVDIVMYPDGRYFDCLIDAGGTQPPDEDDPLGEHSGSNRPSWGEHQGDPQFYRPAVDPGDTAPEPPPVPAVDLTAILYAVQRMELEVALLRLSIAELRYMPAPPLPPMMWPAYSGRLFGYPITLRPDTS